MRTNKVAASLIGMFLGFSGVVFFGPTPAHAPLDPQPTGVFYEGARLDTTQVETAEQRMEHCDLWYFEEIDLLACK